MNLSAYEIALISGGLTLVGVLVGGWVTYRFSINLVNRQEFNKAAAEFRNAFTDEQRLLDPDSSADRASAGSASYIISSAIDKHERAMIRFEPFICKGEIEKYRKAWHDYAGDSRHFEQYTGDNFHKKEQGKALALKRIEELLKFAAPKH